jgi:hypothetical protein
LRQPVNDKIRADEAGTAGDQNFHLNIVSNNFPSFFEKSSNLMVEKNEEIDFYT